MRPEVSVARRCRRSCRAHHAAVTRSCGCGRSRRCRYRCPPRPGIANR